MWYNIAMKVGRENQPGGHVEGATETTAFEAFRVLEGRSGDVGGMEIHDPEKAAANLNRALGLVQSKLGDRVKINLNDVHFRVLEGNIIGESKENGTYIDPIMLMHPVMRLVHVLAHELAHQENEIQNEALVEAFVESVFGESDLDHDYEEGTRLFREFAEKFDANGDTDTGAKKIYELYAAEKYEEIYGQFMANVPEAQRDEAFSFFQKVFPELEYAGDRPGYFGVKAAA